MTNEEAEKMKRQLADVMGEGGSYRNLQVQLDAALQKHKDDAAAHEAAIQALQAKHAEMSNLLAKRVNDLLDEKRQLQETHAATVARLHEEHTAEILKERERYSAKLAEVRAAHDAAVETAAFQVRQYQLAHAEALAILQESPESRLLRAHQAQEAAELKARQDAARAALASKLK